MLAGAVAAYALSPIDLIPDFIPAFGYLDDLAIVPLGVIAAIRLIPLEVLDELLAQAAGRSARLASRAGMAAVLLIWIIGAVLFLWIVAGRLPKS